MLPEDPARALLAEQAAHGLPVVPQLRLLCLAEALTAPAAHRALDLNAELDTLCTALQESVRRRPGWLYFTPAGQCVPAAVPRPLLQAALLCWVHGVLSGPLPNAILQLDATRQAAILVLRGGRGRDLPGDTRSLLLRLAALCGGSVVQSGGPGPFTAALRLPLCTDLPLLPCPDRGDLLYDRYSPLQVFLQGYCTGANE